MFAEIHSASLKHLPLILYTVGEAPHQKPVNNPEGNHFSEFIWVKNGAGVLTVGGERTPFLPGEGIFLPAGVPHGYEGDGPFHTAWVTFLGGEGLLAYLNVGGPFRFTVPEDMAGAAADLDAQANGTDSTPLSRSAAGYAFAAEYLERFCRPRADRLSAVRQYLENHFSEPLSLDDIAAAVGTDRFSLCRYMKKEAGHGVTEELLTIRVRKAKRYLRTNGASVSEVAALCGFSSPSYFTACFRRLTGVTPGAYRQK